MMAVVIGLVVPAVVLVVRATTGPGAANHQPHARDPRDTPRDSGAGRVLDERFRPRGHRRTRLRRRPGRVPRTPVTHTPLGVWRATRQDRDTDPRVRPSTTYRSVRRPHRQRDAWAVVPCRTGRAVRCPPGGVAGWSGSDGVPGRDGSRAAQGCGCYVMAGVGPLGAGGRWVFGGGCELGGQLGHGGLEGCGAPAGGAGQVSRRGGAPVEVGAAVVGWGQGDFGGVQGAGRAVGEPVAEPVRGVRGGDGDAQLDAGRAGWGVGGRAGRCARGCRWP